LKKSHLTNLSRRTVLGSIGAVPVLSVGLLLATQANASAGVQLSMQDRLYAAVRALPLPCIPGHLEIVKFHADGPEITIAVQLNWQPGRRQQVFRAHHATADHSVDALIADVTAWVGRLV
jgi:hypothetical protein